MRSTMRTRMAVLVSVLGLALSGPALAHHAFAMFDSNRELMLDGTVKEFQWTNPHTWVQLLVKEPGGREVECAIEGASPNNLSRFGWTRNSLKTGDHVQVVVHPLKDGSIGGSLVKITVNGQVVGAPKPS